MLVMAPATRATVLDRHSGLALYLRRSPRHLVVGPI